MGEHNVNDYDGGNTTVKLSYQYPPRIQLSFIAPVQDLDMTEWGQQHFILAHLVHEDHRYADFYKYEEKWKLIDNSAYELKGHHLPNNELVDAATLTNANEIVLPDIMFNREATFKATLNFLNDPSVMKEVDDAGWRLMYIPQGRTVGEWIKSYLHDAAFFVGEYSQVQAVGIPIWLDRHARREGVINYVDRRFGLLNCDHHLLGVDDYTELLNYPTGLIRSADSSRVFTLAYHQVHIDNLFNMTPDDHDLESYQRIPLKEKMTPEMRELAMRNIQDVLNYTRYRERSSS